MHIPAVTAQQMVEVDRLMTEEYGIQLVQMMENAGRSLAELSRQLLGGEVTGRRIAVLCGSGNNGGGGMVAARHLSNWGAEVQFSLTSVPGDARPLLARLAHSLSFLGMDPRVEIKLVETDLIIDALIGYGLRDDPQEPAAGWIRRVNGSDVPVLALDTPSGLDVTQGIPGEPCVRATTTMTLALPKTGLRMPQAREYVGDLYLADIGVPPQLYRRLGLHIPPLFTERTIVRL